MGERPFAVAFLSSVFVVVGLWSAGWMEIPTFTYVNSGLLAAALVMCLVNYMNEYHGIFQLSYSKFTATQGSLNARVGWMITYGMPAVVYVILWHVQGRPQTVFHMVALASYVAHFGKRVMESGLVHKYSRNFEISAVVMISSYYLLGAVIQHYWCNIYTTITMATRLSANHHIIFAGMVVFVIGELINLYHHMLLASFRPEGTKPATYVVPSGGLFGLVICPHYFGELVAWLGITIAGQHLQLYLNWLVMVTYLAGRSHQTRIWYTKKIESFPQDLLNLYPGVY